MSDSESNMNDNDSSANDTDYIDIDNDSSADEIPRPGRRRTRRDPVTGAKCDFCGQEFWGNRAEASRNRHIKTKGRRPESAVGENGKDNGRGKHPAVGTPVYKSEMWKRNFRDTIQTPDERDAKKRESDAKYREWRRDRDLNKVTRAFDKLK